MPVKWTQEQLADIARLQEQRNLTVKGAKQYYARQQKKTAAAPAAAVHANKLSHKAAKKSRKADQDAATLGAKDKLPEGVVTRMWEAGKTMTEIAQKIGTGTRPNGTGYRIGRIRTLLSKAGLYPRKGGK
jgi:hypothetical protein